VVSERERDRDSQPSTDRIPLCGARYVLEGDSAAWREHRIRAILEIKAYWQMRGWYYEPSGEDDYFQLYDSWKQEEIRNGLCTFVVDAETPRFIICQRNVPPGGKRPKQFDPLIREWRRTLDDPSIRLRPLR
jgi:hypothetical protein